MQHEEATRNLAAERYLLGELSDAERDQFEEHFFDCPACAEDVRAGAIFEANARVVLADQTRRSPAKPGWWEWICLRPAWAAPLACFAVLLVGVLAYQGWMVRGLRTELAEMRAPQPYTYFFLRSTTRGAEQQVLEVPRESRFFGLSLDLPPGQSFQQYLGEVVSESGAIQFTVPLSKPRTPGEPHNMLIPSSRLESGRRYTLIVRGVEEGSPGKPGIEIASYHFVTQRN